MSSIGSDVLPLTRLLNPVPQACPTYEGDTLSQALPVPLAVRLLRHFSLAHNVPKLLAKPRGGKDKEHYTLPSSY
jgi:hypothetical protein